MADDIDIEEHDLMDNPSLRNMFPDMSVLINEIQNFEGLNTNDMLQSSNNQFDMKYEVFGECVNENKIPVNDKEEYTMHGVISEMDNVNEISSVDNKEVIEIDDDADTEPTTVDHLFNSNKIILGSKPNKALEYEEELFEEKVKSYNVDVVLDDLRPYLDTSGRFCDQCLILFPDKNNLEIHTKKYHYFQNKSTCVVEPTHKQRKSDDKVKNKPIKCAKCNVLFSYHISLYRHNKQFHSGTSQTQINNMISKVKDKIENNIQDQPHETNNKCFHCEKIFPSQKSLIEHLYTILQSKKYVCKMCSQNFSDADKLDQHMVSHKECVIVLKDIADQLKKSTKDKANEALPKNKHPTKLDEKITTNSENNVQDTFCSELAISIPGEKSLSKDYFSCYICSYYYTDKNYYLKHLMNKHNISNYSCKENEKKPFDPICNFCSQSYQNVQTLNAHLLSSHKKIVHDVGEHKLNYSQYLPSSTTSKRYSDDYISKVSKPKSLLKSALFKCSKCDIYFLSSKVAKNHTDHIEMLINWKCSICKRIFKNEDKILHSEQHKYSDEFNVHELCPNTPSPVLYKCLNCTIHFDEDGFFKHHSVCGKDTPNSVFCIICDILIDSSISPVHRSEHVNQDIKSTDYIIVQTDILANWNPNPTTRKECLTVNTETSRNIDKNGNANLKRKSNESANLAHKKEKHSDDAFNLTYCNTCKCFLTKQHDVHILHIEQRCKQLVKYVCQICGLTLTAHSYKTSHIKLHKSLNVKLKDFKFFDISGKQICPPLPEYPKCDTCEVYFTSKGDIYCHECNATDYLTCHLCNINFKEDAFKLHMLFHNYSKSFGINNSSNLTKIPNQYNRKTSSASVTVNHETVIKEQEIISKVQSKSKLNTSLTGKQLQKNKIDNNYKTETQSELENNNKIKNRGPRKSPQKATEKSKNLLTQESILPNINLERIIFKCKNCYVCVHNYDNVIEHCQDHYCNEEVETETVECSICKLNFDQSCFDDHEKLHKLRGSFTILDFDTFYFTSDNKTWTEHLFGSISEKQRDEIVSKSIYKYECRIKMEVIQNGPTDLTVYKCDRCRSFINESHLYKHAENSCFKLRKHPCTVCGLPFNSSVSRIEHEKVHKIPNINLSSYRIVTFNKEEDKIVNKSLYTRSQYYVLYQCRNCSVAVDLLKTRNHNCSERNLKTCLSCGLLISNDDYDAHMLRHQKLSNFIQKNIKVILFGEKTIEDFNEKSKKDILFSKFSGIVYDYTFYCCSKCHVCVKSQDVEKHTCCFGSNRLKCAVCKLYFPTSKLKQHVKMHERDLDFLRHNMRVIDFNPSENVENVDSEEMNNQNKSIDFQMKIQQLPNEDKGTNNEVKEEYAKIYKCFCGLHFLDELSVLSHLRVCDPKSRAAKQNCTKCDLLFTQNVLFNHLIMHHGDKLRVYKYQIIDISSHRTIIYQCNFCELHFATLNDINKHLRACNGSTEGKDCIFCNLKFESASFISHDCSNVNNVCAGSNVITLNEPLVLSGALANLYKNLHGTDAKYSEVNVTPDSTCDNIQKQELVESNKLDINIPALNSALSSNNDNVPKNISHQNLVQTSSALETKNGEVSLENLRQSVVTPEVDTESNLEQTSNKELNRLDVVPSSMPETNIKDIEQLIMIPNPVHEKKEHKSKQDFVESNISGDFVNASTDEPSELISASEINNDNNISKKYIKQPEMVPNSTQEMVAKNKNVCQPSKKALLATPVIESSYDKFPSKESADFEPVGSSSDVVQIETLNNACRSEYHKNRRMQRFSGPHSSRPYRGLRGTRGAHRGADYGTYRRGYHVASRGGSHRASHGGYYKAPRGNRGGPHAGYHGKPRDSDRGVPYGGNRGATRGGNHGAPDGNNGTYHDNNYGASGSSNQSASWGGDEMFNPGFIPFWDNTFTPYWPYLNFAMGQTTPTNAYVLPESMSPRYSSDAQ